MCSAVTELASPLVELTRESVDFKWTDEHTQAVKTLNHKLLNYVTLQVPDPAKPCALKSDALGYAVRSVPEEEGRPLGFLSKKMNPAQMRCVTYSQELLVLIRALENGRRLLLKADVTASTDHQAPQYLLTMKAGKPIRGRFARWLSVLSAFQNLKIVYPPRPGNVVADALSRCPLHEGKKDKYA